MAETPPDIRPTSKATTADLLQLTTTVVASYLSKNTVAPNQLPELIRTVHATLGGLGTTTPATTAPANTPSAQANKGNKPAVSVKKSITPEYLVCLEDGRKLKMLKRHLRSVYNMSPEQYRAKWNLPNDYPMVAPKYAEQRSDFAKKIGLGKGSTGRKSSKRSKAA
jgi:predicted transcriptional regulator